MRGAVEEHTGEVVEEQMGGAVEEHMREAVTSTAAAVPSSEPSSSRSSFHCNFALEAFENYKL